MRATRITIEVKDSEGNWFRVFQFPYPSAGELILPDDAAGRIADAAQRAIAAESNPAG